MSALVVTSDIKLNSQASSVVKTTAPNKTSDVLTPDQISYLRRSLETKIVELTQDNKQMRALMHDSRENAGNGYGTHMGEVGTDNQERAKLANSISRNSELITSYERSLRRIHLETYAICKITGEGIPFNRLQVKPNAVKCIRVAQDLSARN